MNAEIFSSVIQTTMRRQCSSS